MLTNLTNICKVFIQLLLKKLHCQIKKFWRDEQILWAQNAKNNENVKNAYVFQIFRGHQEWPVHKKKLQQDFMKDKSRLYYNHISAIHICIWNRSVAEMDVRFNSTTNIFQSIIPINRFSSVNFRENQERWSSTM